MPLGARTAALEAEINRLRGQRQARLDAEDAQQARLAEIDAATTRNESWSRAEIGYWEQRGARARRRAAEEQHAAWEAQLSANEPARKKLATRLAEVADQHEAVAARHRDEMAEINRTDSELRDQLHELEAVPELEDTA